MKKMRTIFKKLIIVCYEKECIKKQEFAGEKDNNWQLFVTREKQHIKFIGKIKCVQKK